MARGSDAEDFDNMTELITNLAASLLKLKAGGLILIVMLLLAVTREAVKPLDTAPAGGSSKGEADKSTRVLAERLIQLRFETERMNEEIDADESLIKELDQKAAALIKRIQETDQNAKDKK